MKNLPSQEDQALIALTSSMASMVRPALRKEARINIPKIIERNVREKHGKNWTPQSVVKSIYRDTSPKTLRVYELLGIDNDELLELARKGLKRAGVSWVEEPTPEVVKYRPTIKERIRAVGRYIKGLFIYES